MDGTTYTEFEPLLRSLRPGSVVRVYRPFLLGGGKGRTDKQRRIWAERADAIKAKGGKLASINPPLMGHMLTMRAYEEIGNVARGKAGRRKAGRPLKYTKEQDAAMERIWQGRKYPTIRDAIAAIHSLGIKVKRTYLYSKFGPRNPRDA